MAVTTSLYIDKYHPKKDGKCLVSVRVTFERKKKYYQTGIAATKDDFDKAQGVKPRNEFKELALRLQAFEKKAADIIEGLAVFTWAKFEAKYFTERAAKDTINLAFADYAASLRKEHRIGTAVTYECAQTSLNKFKAGVRFADVTVQFLKDYQSWMTGPENKCSITTVGIYLRSLRTLFNNAIADGTLTKDYYPFGAEKRKKYEIPTGKNIKKALTLNDIKAIYYHQPSKGSNIEMSKDLWVFMYLSNGMNMKDMCLLKYGNIKGEMLHFIRAKTKRTKKEVTTITASINGDMIAIIKKWGNIKKDDETFVFPILEKGLTAERERDLIQLKTHLVNDHMKVIAGELEIEGSLTTMAARHSYATIMRRSGASDAFIGESMGHSSAKTTQNYFAGFEDDKKVENAKALTAFKDEKPKTKLKAV